MAPTAAERHFRRQEAASLHDLADAEEPEVQRGARRLRVSPLTKILAHDILRHCPHIVEQGSGDVPSKVH